MDANKRICAVSHLECLKLIDCKACPLGGGESKPSPLVRDYGIRWRFPNPTPYVGIGECERGKKAIEIGIKGTF